MKANCLLNPAISFSALSPCCGLLSEDKYRQLFNGTVATTSRIIKANIGAGISNTM